MAARKLQMLPYPLKTHQLDKEVNPASPPKRRRHTHRDAHNRFYKPTLRAFTPAVPWRLLDGFALLDAAKVERPEEVVTVRLPGERLTRVEKQDLTYFTNLAALSLPDNQLQLEDFCSLAGLMDLDLMCNRIRAVGEVYFQQLQTLNLSYNSLMAEDIERLAKGMPRLRALDLAYNELDGLPADLSGLKSLETLVLAGNRLIPENLFRSVSSLPQLLKLDLSHNHLTGLSDASLLSACLLLEDLDFSYNCVDRPSALSPAVSFPALQVLIITGNPFAVRKEVEELDSQLSITGALLINNTGPSPVKPAYPRPVAIITNKLRPCAAPSAALLPASDLSYRSASVPPQTAFVTQGETHNRQRSPFKQFRLLAKASPEQSHHSVKPVVLLKQLK